MTNSLVAHHKESRSSQHVTGKIVDDLIESANGGGTNREKSALLSMIYEHDKK